MDKREPVDGFQPNKALASNLEAMASDNIFIYKNLLKTLFPSLQELLFRPVVCTETKEPLDFAHLFQGWSCFAVFLATRSKDATRGSY